MPGARWGSSAAPPKSFWPLLTVSRLVPSWLISFNRPASEEAESPSTATIAATPIAMPSADSPARRRRVRRPRLARWNRSDERSGLTKRLTRSTSCERPRHHPARWRGVGHHLPVEHLDAAREAGGEVAIVGDDRDRRPRLMEVEEQIHDGRH